jgi:hypothetical protein
MAHDKEKNEILKKVWSIDDKLLAGGSISLDEVLFYNSNLDLIKNYYKNNAEFWSNKEPINYDI